MTEYIVEDINHLWQEPTKIKAKSPMHACKIAYPERKVERCNTGNIVVTGRYNYRYGIKYIRYVYAALDKT